MFGYSVLLNNLDEKGKEVEVRGKKIKELINYRLVVKRNLYSVPNVRSLEHIKKYLKGELSWYFSGDNKVDGILPYAKFWDSIKNNDGTVNSNYGHLLFTKKNEHGKTQYQWALSQLLKDKYSRQAVMLYHDKDMCRDGNKDFTCTQTQQFFIRDNVLTSIVTIRSSDVIRGLTFDIPFWSIVQQQLYHDLKYIYPDLKKGQLNVNMGSVHVYEEHYDLLTEMLKNKMNYHYVKLNEAIPLGNIQSFYEDRFDSLFTIS